MVELQCNARLECEAFDLGCAKVKMDHPSLRRRLDRISAVLIIAVTMRTPGLDEIDQLSSACSDGDEVVLAAKR